MLFNNPIFSAWYTDTMDVYRVAPVQQGNTTVQKKQKINTNPIPCRIYKPEKDGPVMTGTSSRERSLEKLSCDLNADVRTGDELLIIRGGALGYQNQPERYFAGNPVSYYDPVGGGLTGLQHKAVGLLKDNLIGE